MEEIKGAFAEGIENGTIKGTRKTKTKKEIENFNAFVKEFRLVSRMNYGKAIVIGRTLFVCTKK